MDMRIDDDPRASLETLHEHARRRLLARLRHRRDRVHHVDVRIGGCAGRRRGQGDLYCLMRVQLRGAPAATVVDIGADASATIGRAAERVRRLVEEQLRVRAAPRAPTARA